MGGALYWDGRCIRRDTVLGGALYWEGHCIGRDTVLGGALYWEGHCIRRGTVLGGHCIGMAGIKQFYCNLFPLLGKSEML